MFSVCCSCFTVSIFEYWVFGHFLFSLTLTVSHVPRFKFCFLCSSRPVFLFFLSFSLFCLCHVTFVHICVFIYSPVWFWLPCFLEQWLKLAFCWLLIFCDTVTAFSLVNCKYLLNQLTKLTILIYRAYMNMFLLKKKHLNRIFLSLQCNIKICISSVDCFLDPSDVALLWVGFLCYFHQGSLSSAKRGNKGSSEAPFFAN